MRERNMGKLNKILFLIVLSAISLLSFGKTETRAAAPQISNKAATIIVGNTKTLRMKNTKKKVTWSSSKKTVAKVSSKGVVTGLKKGTATITAKVSGKKYTCKITVKSAVLSAKTATLTVGETKTLKLTNSSGKVTWTSSKKSVAAVSSKGKVTAKSAGTTIIRAKVGSSTYQCTITVKAPATEKPVTENEETNVAASSISFDTEDGGEFLKGAAAVIRFKMEKSVSSVTVQVLNSLDSPVLSSTVSNCTLGSEKQLYWNTNTSTAAGSYRVCVISGTKKTYSSYLILKESGTFAGGRGTAASPYQIASLSQLQKMADFNGKQFVLTTDLNFNYNGITSIFSGDSPFTGCLAGNGHTISNYYGTNNIFGYIGQSGTISNVKFSNCSVSANEATILAQENKGILSNIIFTDSSVQGTKHSALMVGDNAGTIIDCKVDGTAQTTFTQYERYHNYATGIAVKNTAEGKIISCSSSVNATAQAPNYPNASGIVGYNEGLVESCQATGNMGVRKTNNYGGTGYWSGIVGYNKGIVRRCSSSGNISDIAGINEGTIIE